MGLKIVRSLPLLWLAACSISRPEGAFTPDAALPAPPEGFGMSDDDDADGDAMEKPAEGDASDEGPDGTGDDDAGEDPDVAQPHDDAPSDPSNPLSALEGRYLMRHDMYSNASQRDSASGSTLTIDSRVSNLFFVELKLENGVLKGREQLCFHSYTHECVAGCSSWDTSVDDQVDPFLAMRSIERAYELVGDKTLRAGTARLPLGYDDPDPMISTMPSAETDANVWSLDATSAHRRGVHTLVRAVLKPAVGSVDFACEIVSVFLFASGFEAELPQLSKAALADGHKIALDVEGSYAKVLYAVSPRGDPSYSALSAEFCAADKISTAEPAGEYNYVRFKPAGALTGCPASAAEFDRAFPVEAVIKGP